MQEKCCNCGEEYNTNAMIPIFTGASTKWFCWDCYKLAQSEAIKVGVKTADKKRKEINRK